MLLHRTVDNINVICFRILPSRSCKAALSLGTLTRRIAVLRGGIKPGEIRRSKSERLSQHRNYSYSIDWALDFYWDVIVSAAREDYLLALFYSGTSVYLKPQAIITSAVTAALPLLCALLLNHIARLLRQEIYIIANIFLQAENSQSHRQLKWPSHITITYSTMFILTR